MLLPKPLQNSIENGLHYLKNDPDGELNLGRREAIWKLFGPTAQDARVTVGHKRRFRLAELTLNHVLPIWTKAFPDDDTPQRALKEAKHWIEHRPSNEHVEKQTGSYWDHLDELANQTNDMAVGVGYAAAQLLETALDDEPFDPEDLDIEATDHKEFAMNDTTFFAAAAYADGMTSNREGDPKKRREFWEWWLREAVPQAWKATDL